MIYSDRCCIDFSTGHLLKMPQKFCPTATKLKLNIDLHEAILISALIQGCFSKVIERVWQVSSINLEFLATDSFRTVWVEQHDEYQLGEIFVANDA